jgi:hypothetical protein
LVEDGVLFRATDEIGHPLRHAPVLLVLHLEEEQRVVGGHDDAPDVLLEGARQGVVLPEDALHLLLGLLARAVQHVEPRRRTHEQAEEGDEEGRGDLPDEMAG